ncbi:4Fe-4S dicluster domain-containing protein [Actinacidiphila acididurans]|uniref:4Fe-4S dicluster domain-containing protein n=1 Tax=Actinacidiphila acididurans TaxID=2784346 RepID=A0ABS2TSE9_9ACTN|nr:4Fe-4S dicluster domain-containing protein [Actinacidiphila acididurans]MBM9506264.1 4Fe-4S dicluster domain-containing protein [Actinacidiphila acididurans]
MSSLIGRNLLAGPEPDPAGDAGHGPGHPPRMGFFTDTSVCIGCKACEVACKEWNAIPEDGLELTGMSYDNTQGLGADTWRHVAFIEQSKPLGHAVTAADHSDIDVLALAAQGSGTPPAEAAVTPTTPAASAASAAPDAPPAPDAAAVPGPPAPDGRTELRWLMSSDVCKHCTHAACLDVCPTGALFRTEFGTVVVQEDVCNGCGYCVPACPYGVIDQRKDDGRVFKCTMCYDRLGAGQEPACAKACPTDSIQFGPLDELRERAAARVEQLHETGVADARLYGADPEDGVGGDGAFFLLLDDPEVYGLPPDPVVTTRDLPSMWRHAGVAAATLLGGLAAVFAANRMPGGGGR